MRELLIAVGEDPDRDGLLGTPRRVARAFAEQFAGLHTDPDTVLQDPFDENHNEMILMRDIAMYSHLRAPPGAVLRQGARRLHPAAERPGHRPVASWPGWSTSTPSARRCRNG